MTLTKNTKRYRFQLHFKWAGDAWVMWQRRDNWKHVFYLHVRLPKVRYFIVLERDNTSPVGYRPDITSSCAHRPKPEIRDGWW